MKLHKKLGKKLFLILLLIFYPITTYGQTKDIWQKSKELKIEKNELEKSNQDQIQNNNDLPPTVFDKENADLKVDEITQLSDIQDNEVIFGLFEPNPKKINLNFWANVDQQLYENIMNVVLQTNSKSLNAISERILFTKTNLSVFEDKGKAHLNNIADWLIKNRKMKFIDTVIYQNDMINQNSKFLEFLFNYYLINGQVNKSCTYANLMTINSDSAALEKYKIFCLINDKKNKQALSQLELTKETRDIEKFFIDKISFLTGLSDQKGNVNFDNVFNGHLTLMVNEDYSIKYEDFSKTKDLRNYFFKNGLDKKLLQEARDNLTPDNKTELNNLVIFLERSSNEDLYSPDKILDIYKKYNFSFEQLLKPIEASENLRRPESHAILYQGMILAQDPDIKLNILNQFKDKLKLNGLDKVIMPIYYKELEKIISQKPDLISDDVLNQMKIFKREARSENDFNSNYLFSSRIKKLIQKDLDKKEKQEAIKLLEDFDKKVKNNEYNIGNKDKALINILEINDVNIPNNLKKHLISKDIYIPSDVFNSIEKGEKDLALLKTMIFINNSKESESNYARNVLSIIKIFDKLDFDEFKQIYLKQEFKI